MKSTIPKQALLDILRENRENHMAEFERAVEGYRKRREQQLEELLADIRAGRINDKVESLPVPFNQQKDYDRVIRLVELDVSDTVTLDEGEVAQYIMDDWRWKQNFTASNSYYVQ
jgi:hypothetical protein